MLHVGLDLSGTRLDVHAMDEAGTSVAITTAAPDAAGLPRWSLGWVSSGGR